MDLFNNFTKKSATPKNYLSHRSNRAWNAQTVHHHKLYKHVRAATFLINTKSVWSKKSFSRKISLDSISSVFCVHSALNMGWTMRFWSLFVIHILWFGSSPAEAGCRYT